MGVAVIATVVVAVEIWDDGWSLVVEEEVGVSRLL